MQGADEPELVSFALMACIESTCRAPHDKAMVPTALRRSATDGGSLRTGSGANPAAIALPRCARRGRGNQNHDIVLPEEPCDLWRPRLSRALTSFPDSGRHRFHLRRCPSPCPRSNRKWPPPRERLQSLPARSRIHRTRLAAAEEGCPRRGPASARRYGAYRCGRPRDRGARLVRAHVVALLRLR